MKKRRKPMPPPTHLSDLERVLRGTAKWGAKQKAALKRLHRAARAERAADSRALGAHQRLELALFGDPRRQMMRDRELGPGFPASLIDGIVCINLCTIAGISPSEQGQEQLDAEYSWLGLIESLKSAEALKTGETETPRESDVFFWVSVSDPMELARELREVFVRYA